MVGTARRSVEFAQYLPAHARTLTALTQTRAWQQVLDGPLVEAVRRSRLAPPAATAPPQVAATQLVAVNQARVCRLIDAGERDVNTLARELGRWPSELPSTPALSFLGLNLSTACNFDPRCVYCNQYLTQPTVQLDDWKAIVREVTAITPLSDEATATQVHPYIAITGGEPLLFGEQLYGPAGLIAYATQRGAAVNVNTNATLMTPEAALALIRAGTARVHVSLDSPLLATQDQLAAGRGRAARILRGLHNLQIARELVGVDYPEIHTNYVLTTVNFHQFPSLIRYLLSIKRPLSGRRDPLLRDLLPHVIPVGGPENDAIRLSAEQFQEFFAGIWAAAAGEWEDYKSQLDEPSLADLGFDDLVYFGNPWQRVTHEGNLEAYSQLAAEDVTAALALTAGCPVAPTQAAVAPDGLQYRCGAHAVARAEPLGHVRDGVGANIRRGLPALADYPTAACRKCALATLFINQAIAQTLAATAAEWIAAVADAPATAN